MATRIAPDDKLIVSNRGALRKKYGAAGFKQVAAAAAALVAADKKRGLRTRVLYLDDPRSMKMAGAPPVTEPAHPRQNKAAIDAVYNKYTPDYLVLLGAPDVIPHQDVLNPVYRPGDDDDRLVLSDVPYACDAEYSRDAAKFVGPSRVVTRLPDLAGSADVSFLLRLLKTAAGYRRRSHTDYARCFGLTARVWQSSTGLSLFNLFGNDSALKSSPEAGPRFTSTQLAPLVHFINCHGASSDPSFYGESGEGLPEALTSKALNRRIKPGTLVAAECCYGGELYDSVGLGLDLPICQTYLDQGAYAYMGSTTVAYGPATGNGQADLICQYFLLRMFKGASVGRAGLEARQRFIRQAAQMDPVDLKTLMQFCVYGDASLHPVAVPAGTDITKAIDRHASERFLRSERRAGLMDTGQFLARSKPTASRKLTLRPSSQISAQLAAIRKAAGLAASSVFSTYSVRTKAPSGTSRGPATLATLETLRYHVSISASAHESQGQPRAALVVVAKEALNRIVAYRVYERR
jgi:hypothetical protein